MNTTVLDQALADPRFEPVFAELNRRQAVLYLHPAGNSACTPLIKDFSLTWMVGAPVEDTISVMQRLRLTAPQLDGFGYLPGQDVMLLVAAEGNRPVRRRYTIRQLDTAARLLTLDIVLHGDGPGERWVRSAQPGDRIEGIGPRGKITTSPAADWHLFIGDESALPSMFAMTEALPPDRPATLVLEIPQESDEQDLAAAATTRISWLHRLGAPAGDPSALGAEAGEIELPPGRGHARGSARHSTCLSTGTCGF